MSETLSFDTSEEIINGLLTLVKEKGPVTIETIYPPGTPVAEVSLAHSQSITKKYLVKINYGV